MSEATQVRLMLPGSLVLVVFGVLLAIVGNAWQGSIASSIRDEAVATGPLGSPLTASVAVKSRPRFAGGDDGATLRIFVDVGGLVDRGAVEDALRCESDREIDRPEASGGSRYKVTKLDDYYIYGSIDDARGEIRVRCAAPGLDALTGDEYVLSTGGAHAGAAVVPLVGGIILACVGGGLLIAALFLRRGLRRSQPED